MAERRMFSKAVIDSDIFLDMPLSAQALYFHLAMRADDDGFVGNPRKIQRMVGSNDDDYKLLIAKQFIIAFESGVIVIKHWRVHNCIRNDRRKETVYTNEKACIETTESGIYTLCPPNDNQMTTNRQPNDNQTSDTWETQYRLGEDRRGKDSIGEDRETAAQFPLLPAEKQKNKSAEYKTIIDYLNEKAGTAFKASSRDTQKHINARLAEGFTVEDFKTVIDKKCTEWKGTEWAKYLRPMTLFGSKFESYLNGEIVKPKGQDTSDGGKWCAGNGNSSNDDWPY